MLVDFEELKAHVTPAQQIHRVAWAALRIGRADAMIANLQVAGMPERIDAWQAERTVWSERKDEAIADTALGKTYLSEFAGRVTAEAREANIICEGLSA